MCIRFVHRGADMITGFNFDIDLAVWNHRLIREKERFYIGILRPDGQYHSYHGVNRNGNAGTLLYVHGEPSAAYREDAHCMTIADLTEQFIRAQITFDQARHILQTQRIVYAPDATMQALLSDAQGRALIVEPGIGWREETQGVSLLSNYSVIDPPRTSAFVVPGDDRYERASALLAACGDDFTAEGALRILQALCQEEPWATRVSFVYSAQTQTIHVVENRRFDRVTAYRLA